MDNKEEEDGLNYDKEQPMAPFWQLYTFTSGLDKVFLAIGAFAAFLSGISMPFFVVFLSDLYDSFSPNSSSTSTYGKLKNTILC